MSTPDWRRCMAVVWRIVCGETVRSRRSGNADAAVVTARFSRCSIPERDMFSPRRSGKSGASSGSSAWRIHIASKRQVPSQSGTTRSFLPLPWSSRHLRRPMDASLTAAFRTSETRAPVLYIVESKAWSRRPLQVVLSGALRIAAISSRLRNPSTGRSNRFMGIARTR